ncbi:AAA family ATPase [soil metagenome]
MICSRCGRENVRSARFCTNCGGDLGPTCPHCGFENPPESKFCGGCGHRLQEVHASDAEGERRQITVLFCDLVGSTELSQRLDPEDLRDVIAAYQSVCGEAVGTHEGYVAQYLGDGIIVYFGYPRAQEDDAQRAVRCGLDMLRRVRTVARQIRPDVTLAVRVAVHTGRVVVGPVGAGDRQDRIALGDAPNIAARLQGAAEPGTLVVSDATWGIVSGYFTGRSVGELQLKGIAQPMEVWLIDGETAWRDRLDAAGRLAPFVGRERERRLLEEAWQAAQRGETGFILLRGDAGVGKSRLGRLFRDQAEASGAAVLVARASPYNSDSPFYPIIELLAQRFGLEPGQSADEQLARLEGALRELHLDPAVVVPFLAPLLTIPAGDRYAAPDLSPIRRRARTMEVIAHLFGALAEQTPTLLVFEDLHWADTSTAELLELIVDTLSGVPLLGLIAARPDLDASWGKGTRLQCLDLTKLDPAQAEALAQSVAGGKALPGKVLRQIVARSDGVPLFIEEMTRAVLESGVLSEGAAAWEARGPVPEDLIPATVAASLTARIDRLGTSRATAQLAATIGREFGFALLREVSERDEPTLRQDIKRLTDAGLAWATDESGAGTFMFKHALVRDAAYESLLRATRQSYHSRIAAAMRSNMAQFAAERPDLIAHHLTQAGEYQDAVGFWETAGQQALQRSAMHDASVDFQRAIGCLSNLPPAREHKERELELHLQLAPVLMAVYGWAAVEVEQSCERGRALAEELERFDRIYPPLWGLWTVYFLRGQLEPAMSAAEAVQRMAEASGVPMIQITGRHATAYTLLYRGEIERALDEANAGLALFDFEQEKALTSMFQLSSSVCLRTVRAHALSMLGHVAEAEAEWERMVQLARDLQHLPTLAAALAFFLHGYGYRHSHLHRIERLCDVADELRSLCKDEGFLLWLAVGENYRGVIGLALGEEDARTRMQEGLELFLQTGTRVTLVLVYVMMAEALYELHEDEEAFRLLDEAEAEMEARGERLNAPEIWRVRGRLLARRGDAAAAEAAYRHALHFAGQQKVRSLELRAALDLYDLLATNGRVEEGRARLAASLDSLPEGLDRPEPARALAILGGSS